MELLQGVYPFLGLFFVLLQLQAESEAAKSGIVLNGVFGGFVLLAILAILAAAGYGVYLKFYSPSSKYTLVVKSGDV